MLRGLWNVSFLDGSQIASRGHTGWREGRASRDPVTFLASASHSSTTTSPPSSATAMPPTSHGTHYHAYLPPSVLTPLDECKLPSAKAIKLYPVPIPVSTPQRPVPKPAKPTSNRAPLTAPVPSTPIVNPPTSLPNSEAGPSRSSGRARAVPQPSVTLSQTENRRRSKRLRTDGELNLIH